MKDQSTDSARDNVYDGLLNLAESGCFDALGVPKYNKLLHNSATAISNLRSELEQVRRERDEERAKIAEIQKLADESDLPDTREALRNDPEADVDYGDRAILEILDNLQRILGDRHE